MWARIENNEVKETVNHDPRGIYHPDLIWVECSGEVRERWTYSSGTFLAPSEPQGPSESELAKRALLQSDASMIRVIDDLFLQVQALKTLCISKGIFTAEEAPAIAAAVETKLKARADLRVKVGLEVKL